MSDSVDWIFELSGDYAWSSSMRPKRNLAFYDTDGDLRMTIDQTGIITIKSGYAWDGCTPKFNLWDISVGTPDGVVNARTRKPKAYYASLIHDGLCQFLPTDPPYSRLDADKEFLAILTRDAFGPRHIYFVAVAVFGIITKRIEAWKRNHDGHWEAYESAPSLKSQNRSSQPTVNSLQVAE